MAISVISENLSQINWIVLEKFFSKNLKIYKECMSLLTFCLPVILQFLIAAITFVTDCKELKLAQAAKINQLASIWYTPISIKVASEKNDAWSMFHSPRCITVASQVNFVPATSLETQKANAANASMLCQQNVKTIYFKTLNPRLFNQDSDLKLGFSLWQYVNAANFQRVCLARARGNFG